MSVQDGVITKSVLKLASGEFDLESIHTLVLRDSDITDLGCLAECTVLERLDLSKNDITKLHKLAGLSALQSLNLAANRISSLEGLQSLESLRSLNLAGNLIGSVDNLQCLCGLEHLKELRLKDEANDLTNPACMLPTYTNAVISMFPTLMVLDGHRVRGQGSELFYICQDMEKTLNGFKGPKDISVPLVDIHRQPSELWRFPDKTSQNTHNRAEEQLKDLLTSCQHLSNRAAERLQDLQLSTPAANSTESDGLVAMETAEDTLS